MTESYFSPEAIFSSKSVTFSGTCRFRVNGPGGWPNGPVSQADIVFACRSKRQLNFLSAAIKGSAGAPNIRRIYFGEIGALSRAETAACQFTQKLTVFISSYRIYLTISKRRCSNRNNKKRMCHCRRRQRRRWRQKRRIFALRETIFSFGFGSLSCHVRHFPSICRLFAFFFVVFVPPKLHPSHTHSHTHTFVYQ